MGCDEVREGVEAFVLGALEPQDARSLEAHLAGCDECARQVDAYRTTVDHLAMSVPLYRAPARLKERIMVGIGAARPAFLPRSLVALRWWAGAAAAVLVAFAVGGITWAVILSSEVRDLREDNRQLAELSELDAEQRSALLQLRGDLISARSQQERLVTTLEEQATFLVLALDPDLIPTELEGTQLAPEAGCSYVWSRTQEVGALTCQDLPSTSFSLVYELWVTLGDETIGVGTFLPRTDGTAQLLVKLPAEVPGRMSRIWVTLEQQTPTGETLSSSPGDEVILLPVPPQQAAR